MHLGGYRVSIERQSRGIPLRTGRRLGRAAVVAAAVVLASTGLAPAAFASSSSGTANFSLGVVPQIRSVTVTPSITSFSSCSGGNSTSTALGFPNGSCYAGTLPGINGSTFVSAVTIQNTGVGGTIDISGQNAVPNPTDGNAGWSLCTANVTGPTLCSTNSGASPGPDQYALFGAAQNERAGIPNVLNTPACDLLFDVTTNGAPGGCTASSGQSGAEALQLFGPASSTDQSPSWTVSVTWTAAP